MAEGETALDLRGLHKRYGDVVALDGVSFSVAGGEMFGFVGPNGAGKTTTMRIVLGVLAADAGEVLWRGAPIGDEERRRIGYMPEERGLYAKMRVRDHGRGDPQRDQAGAAPRRQGARGRAAGAAADRDDRGGRAGDLFLMVAAILVVVYLAGRIYERSVLRFGTPLKLRQALKLVRT